MLLDVVEVGSDLTWLPGTAVGLTLLVGDMALRRVNPVGTRASSGGPAREEQRPSGRHVGERDGVHLVDEEGHRLGAVVMTTVPAAASTAPSPMMRPVPQRVGPRPNDA